MPMLRVLQVMESDAQTQPVVKQFERAGYTVHSVRVEDARQMRSALAFHEWDVTISEYFLPRFTAPEALGLLREMELDIPFIVVSATIGEEIAVAMMKCGAHDYILKRSLTRLVPAVEREVQEARMRRERGEARRALEESERRYRSLFEFNPAALVLGEAILDSAGKPVDWRYLDVNRGFTSMSGKSAADVISRTFRECFPEESGEEEWIATLGQVAITGNPTRFEWYSAGRQRYYEAIAYCPNPGRFAAILTDITDRKSAEERVRERQKLETIGNLAGGLAHDLNNALTVIMGSAGLALETCALCAHSEAILSASRRAAFLTRQLLAYAGKGQNAPKPVDISDLISRSAPLLAASVPARIRLTFDLDRNLPHVLADPAGIEQVAVNLVTNAVEAIPPAVDGWIVVSTSRSEVGEDAAKRSSRAWEVEPGIYARLSVRDNGAGMDEETLSRIFDPFYSTKFEGRGLGLAAVQGIVRSAKGFSTVKSSPGRGSYFEVYLPAANVQKPAAMPAPRPAPLPRAVPTVLVVDDEDMVRRLTCMMLRRHGYETMEAENGRRALDAIAGAAAPPALVFTDLAMPVMGGEELVPVLAKEHPEIKIIVTSGYPEDELRKHFPRECMAGFLKKPYTAPDLIEMVREAIGEPLPRPRSGPAQDTRPAGAVM